MISSEKVLFSLYAVSKFMTTDFVHGITDCIFSVFSSGSTNQFAYILTNNRSWEIVNDISFFTNVNHIPFVLLNTDFSDNVHMRSDSLIIVVGCDFSLHPFLFLTKNSRLAYVNTTIIVLAQKRCNGTINNEEKIAEALIKEVRQIVNPSWTLIVFTDNDQVSIFWTQAYTEEIHNQSACIDSSSLRREINFKQRLLRSALAPQPPYGIVTGNGFDGVEPRIIKTFAEKYNFTLRFMSTPKGELPRILHDANGKTAGLLGMLDRLEADIASAGITSDPERDQVVELITPHTMDATRWVIPSPPRANSWSSIYTALSIDTWICVIATLIGTTMLTTFFFSSGDTSLSSKINNAILRVFSAHLDQGYRITSNRSLLRIFVLTYLAYCVIITNAYRSALSTLLTAAPKVRWYETIDEVLADGHIVYLIPSGRISYILAAEKDLYWRFIMQPGKHIFTDNVPKTLTEIAENRTGVMLSIGHPSIFAIRTRLTLKDKTPMLITLSEQQMTFLTTIFGCPAFPLYITFTDLVLNLVAGGIVDYWRLDILYVAELSASLMDNENVEGPEKLSLQHLGSAFIVLFVLLTLGCLTFAIEVLCRRQKLHSLKSSEDNA